MKKILFLFILSSFITACREHKKTYVADIKENAIAIDSFYHKENIFKYTQLGIECKIGNLDNVKQLLAKGANSRFAKKDDYLIYDALFVSIENRHLPIVKYLVENNISDINQIYTEEGLTPLGLARKIGDKEIVSYLIKQGASDWLGIYSGDFLYLKEEKADPRAWGKILVKIDDNIAHLQIETYDKSNDKEYVFKEEKNNEISFVDLKREDYIKIIKKNSTYLLKSSFLDSLLDKNNLYTIEKIISK
ncbi:ankyrin repeat domain-containing protein [Capnocytophaga sputigena]|uniref:ankyrin repeat domain-containing protein n=1 Tax=Capnocytophaga sputigena TaxID=1019 RepID=UPI0028D09253|nr:ankyrin repeat domain-containing protein [Capnocytophaga sputigena]